MEKAAVFVIHTRRWLSRSFKKQEEADLFAIKAKQGK